MKTICAAFLALAVAGCSSAGQSSAPGSVMATDPQLGACGGPVSNVRAAFDLAHARDLWSHIPGFLRAPELLIDDPAHVVVYKPDVEFGPDPNGGNVLASGDPSKASHIVCVAINGVATYYTSVDTSVVRP